MSSEETDRPPEGGDAPPSDGVINFQIEFQTHEMKSLRVPVEVRGGQPPVVRHSTAPGVLHVTPGKYLVSARLPAGQELFEEVEVPPNGNVLVRLAPREEEGSQRELDEVSYYLGLSKQTLMPTRTQARRANWSSPLALPVSASEGVRGGGEPRPAAATAAALPFAPLEELGLEVGEAGGGGAQFDASIDTLLAEYARLQTEEQAAPALETMGRPEPPARPDPAVARPATRGLPASDSAVPIELSLRLFRGNPLKTAQVRPVPATELELLSQEETRLRLRPKEVNVASVLQVSQPGRPVLNILLPMSSECGCEVVVARVRDAARAGGLGDDVSVDVHLGNREADMLLRYRAQGMMAEAMQLLQDKYDDPVGAAVGAYGLLQLNRLEPFGQWARNLYADFPWLPDGAAIEGERLAREGNHQAALDAFLALADRGLPLFSEGLGYTVDRLDLYVRSAHGGLDPEKVSLAGTLLALLRNYSQYVDFRKLLLRFTGRLPCLPGAEAYEPPRAPVLADPTVLSVTMEGGEGGRIYVKEPRPAPSPAYRGPAGRGGEETSDVESGAGVLSERQAEAEMRLRSGSPAAFLPERRAGVGADLIKGNDPHSIALRVQRILSQSNTVDALVSLNAGAEGGDEGELLERIIAGEGGTRAAFLELGSLMARTVARVRARDAGRRESFATGFMVSPRLLLTVHHAVPDVETARRSQAEFDYQHDVRGALMTPHAFDLRPEVFFLSDEALDFTLVAVEQFSAGGGTAGVPLAQFGCIRLSAAPGKILVGESVNIIHHPRGGPKQFLLQQNAIVGQLEDYLHYRAATEPGSAGAPLYNNQWEAVALHHAKAPLRPPGGPAAGEHWVCEAVRISSILRACSLRALAEPQQRLLGEMLSPPEVVISSPPAPALHAPPDGPRGGRLKTPPVTNTEPPPPAEDSQGREPAEQTLERLADMLPREETTSDSRTPDVAAGEVAITIPLRIGVSLGAAEAPRLTTTEAATDEGFLESVKPDKDYSNRPGYDPHFLGFPVHLPTLTPAMQAQAVEVPGGGGANKHELKYYHYSVIMNRRRRLAFVSAVNMDANAKHHFEREEGDRWFMDPRIPREYQAGEEIYSKNPLDRGHLARRADAAWGRTEEEAKLANDDTFHFTNCSPQHEIFNQSKLSSKRQLLLWGNIENHIARQGKVNKKRLSVFNGPVFRQNDRKHRGLPIPREYWKIVVFRRDDGKPAALAFLLSQASLIKPLPTEEFEVGPYDTYQVRVREIEAKTKLDFGSLRDHDPLEHAAEEGLFESADDILPLKDFRDIIL